MVKTTIKGRVNIQRTFTANDLLRHHPGEAFVGTVSKEGKENDSQAIFWVSHWAINAFGVHPNDYMNDASWNNKSCCIFHVDRFIDIEVKEL